VGLLCSDTPAATNGAGGGGANNNGASEGKERSWPDGAAVFLARVEYLCAYDH